ncbi:rhomboid family intramembrane serine protease [Rhodosalinus sp. FB01]|uniref:rhomboid family intramembrane serine protease n=1 Tax=Rhodosalinus sp. FB01 TaxID=3239194 RepID=UPI003524DBFB
MRPFGTRHSGPGARRRVGLPGAVLALVAINLLVEACLAGADAGWWGSPAWRTLAYHNGAFWGGLLDNWRPNYPLQPATMFATYAFLHAGLGHLAGNMLVLLILGGIVARRAGQGGFVVIYLASAVLGGAAFAVLSDSPQPMVGASGALFGLAGAWKAWELDELRAAGLSRWPVWRDIAALAALNVIFWYLLGGVLAWQTHLGGFLGGALVSTIIGPRHIRPCPGD